MVVGCDDGRVEKLGAGFTVYACIAFEGIRPIGAHMGLVRVDGLEASSLISYSVLASSAGRAEVLFLDSLTMAGFNVVSPATIEELAGAATIVTYKYRPSYERLHRAFKRLQQPELRARILRLVDRAFEAETPHGRLYVLHWGISRERALEIIREYQVHSRIPEPIRIAHEVASEASRIVLKAG